MRGGKESEQVLRSLGKSATRQVRLKALRFAGRPVRQDMKQLAPVASGALRNSIVMRTIRAVLPTIGIGPTKDIFYAHILEFGSRFLAPVGFMRRAVDQNEQTFGRRYGDALGREMVRAAERQAGPLRRAGLLSRRGLLRRFTR